MELGALAALTAAGLAVGFVAGLVGIGGGVLLVPFLYFFYGHPAWRGATVAAGVEAAVAHATSLAIILPTAVLGVATYARSGFVAWRAVLPIAGASMVGAAFGARLAVALPDELLRLGFGLFLIATAVQLTGRPRSADELPLRTSPAYTIPAGLGIGVFSALLGVGGGLVAIPVLLYLIRLDLSRVAATSLAVVAFASAAGTVTYGLSGSGIAGVPPGSVGYVDLATALPMALGAIASVPLGTWANRRVEPHVLRRVFAVLFLVLGIRLVVMSLWLPR